MFPGLFLTKLSLMSRVLLLGRAWSSNSVIGEARWSSHVCSGWDWTETPVPAIIRLAITSRPLKLLSRFILFSLRLGKQPSMFYGLSFFFCFLFWGKQSLLKFRHPARTLPGRMHWKLANKLPRLRMFQSLDVKYRKKFKSDLKQKEKFLTTNDRLKSWWNLSGITQPQLFFSPSLQESEETPVKNLLSGFLVSGIVMELRK